jgi:hypothetical protein
VAVPKQWDNAMRVCDRYVEMSKSRVESRETDDGDGRGKEMIAITSRSGRGFWELWRETSGAELDATSAKSLPCMSESTSSACECFKDKPRAQKIVIRDVPYLG